MAKHRSRGSKSLTLPIAPLAGLAAGVGDIVTGPLMGGDYKQALAMFTLRYTGFNPNDGKFEPTHPDGLIKGLAPLVAGMLIHKFVGGRPLNVNAALARAGVPVIRI